MFEGCEGLQGAFARRRGGARGRFGEAGQRRHPFLPRRGRGGVRWPACVAVLAVVPIAMAACGASHTGATDNPKSSSVRIKATYLAQAKATVLVNGAGYSLYMFVPDQQRAVTCNVTCLASWPPMTISPGSRPQVGAGVNRALVSSVAFSPGYRVVTYNRWPLYTYEDDVNPGMDTGQGINLNGGYWYLMSPNGAPLVPAGDPSA